MDITQRIDTLERRLSAMERKSRAWRILALLLLVALVGGVASEGAFDNASWAADEKAATEKVRKFDVVEAKTFRIKDEKGRLRFRVSSSGVFSTFVLLSGDGKTRVSAIVQGAPGLKQAAGGAQLIVEEKRPSLRVTGHGETVLGGSYITVNDAQTTAEFQQLNQKNYRGIKENIELLTPRERERWRKLLLAPKAIRCEAPDEEGGGAISVRNPFGKTVVRIQSNKTNQGGVYVSDVNGKTVGVLAAP